MAGTNGNGERSDNGGNTSGTYAEAVKKGTYAEAVKKHYRRSSVYSNKLLREWSGFCRWAGCSDKKLWDVLQLLGVPLVIFLVSWGFNDSTKQKDVEQAKQKERQEALTKYIDEVPNLIYQKSPDLLSDRAFLLALVQKGQETGNNISSTKQSGNKQSEQSNKTLILLRAKTRLALQLLEGDFQRRDALLAFLKESQLSHRPTNNSDNNKLQTEMIPGLTGNLFEKINLTGINLSEANLVDANLMEANLDKADLRATKLNNANLSNAQLNGANLTSKNIDLTYQLAQVFKFFVTSKNDDPATTLTRANLQGVTLHEAKLDGAILKFANLRGAIFGTDVGLSGTDLSGANLIDADLSQLKKSDILTANLENAFYSEAKDIINCKSEQSKYFLLDSVAKEKKMFKIGQKTEFSDKIMKNKNDRVLKDILSKTDLSNINLTGTIFPKLNLEGTNFKNSILTDVDLRQAEGLSKEQLSNAKLCRTKIPSNIKGLDVNEDCSVVNNSHI